MPDYASGASSRPRSDARTIALTLASARAERRSIEPFTDGDPGFDAAAAYAAQDIGIDELVRAGDVVVGAKLGLTSLAKQRAMSVDEPLFGWLTDQMLLVGSDPLPLDRWIHPRVEPEICFLFDEAVSGPITPNDVVTAASGVCAALEIIDSRYTDFRFRLPDVVADNASAAGFVVGAEVRKLAGIEDLAAISCVLRRDGEVVATATGADVMGHPANAVAWLVNQLADHGRRLPAGSLVLSGGMTDAVAIQPGGRVSAELTGLGTIEVFA